MASDKEAHVTLKLFNQDFNQAMAETKSETTRLNKEFELQKQQMKLTATEAEQLAAKVEYLKAKQEIASRVTQETAAQYEKAKVQFGENSVEAEKFANKLLEAQIAEQKLANEIAQTNQQLDRARAAENQLETATEQATDSLKKQSQAAEETAKKLQDTGEAAKSAGEKMAGITAAIGAVGAGSLLVATDLDSAMVKIQTSIGATEEDARQLGNVAENVWKKGFAGSLDEAAAALIQVKQNMRGLSGEELETATQNAIALSQTFEADVNEVTRAANNLMLNFGMDSQKAFDMMTAGAQNGLNFSNELFDNLTEYAPLWSDMGFSAEEMFGILSAGAENGVYNFDYLNDVMKEFGIRIADGSKATSDAMEGMTRDTQDLYLEFIRGNASAADMAKQIATDLSTLDDQVERNALGVALFGTKWEDLGGDVVLSMLSADAAMTDFTGKMEEMAKAQEESFGQRFQGNLRAISSSLEPLGLILMDIVERIMPNVTQAFQTASDIFANLSPNMQLVILAVAALIAAIGPLLIIAGTLIGSIGSIIGAFTPLFAAVTSAGGLMAFLSTKLAFLGTALSALTGPVGLAVLAIGAIITACIVAYEKVEWFRDGVNAVFSKIQEVTMIVFNSVKDLITSLISSAVDFAQGILERFKEFWAENGAFIEGIVKKYLKNIKNNIEMVLGIIKGIFEVVWPIISGVLTVAWEMMQLTIQNALDLILGIIQFIMKLIKGDWEGAWNTIKDIAERIMNNVVKFFEDIDLFRIGKDIIQGLINGIGSMASAVWNKVTSIVDGIKSVITGDLDINSPSLVMRGFGVNIGEGLVNGIDATVSTVAASAAKLADAVKSVNYDYSTVDSSRHFNPIIHYHNDNADRNNANRDLRKLAFMMNY